MQSMRAVTHRNGTQGMRSGWRQERRFRLWSMNTEEIEYILNRHLKDFDSVFSSNTLPQSPRLLVCYSDPAHKTHDTWCAYTSRTVMENILTPLDVDLMYVVFEHYLNRYCSSWNYNDRQLQSVVSKFCGHYCIYCYIFEVMVLICVKL